jgi:dTDP-4-dehydrorhamnose 3,5-epimerase
MKFARATLSGVFLIQPEFHEDERGFLARTYCENEFSEQGLNTRWPQCNQTHTKFAGMIRGLRFQAEPKPEIKLVRCTMGAVFDVVVDARRGSPTFGRWEGFELTAANGHALYVPGGFAHGFQCLVDRCEMLYQMSEFYFPELSRGVRWNDPAIGIKWPVPNPKLSERDRDLPLLESIA